MAEVCTTADVSKIAVGDWIMSGPPIGRGRLFQRGIRLTGSVHTHDELVGRRDGKLVAGNARAPHFELTPIEERLAEAQRGDAVLAIFRFYNYLAPILNAERYRRFQDGVEVALKVLAELKIPYDKRAIASHARNEIRRRLGYLRWLGARRLHVEYKIFCTESCFTVYHVLGINLRGLAGNQPLVAPVHAEQLYRAGYLVPILDLGLLEHVTKGGEK